MKRRQVVWLVGGLVLTIFIFVIAQQFIFSPASAEQLSRDEAEQHVSERFAGEIKGIRETASHYEFEVELKTGVYRVSVEKQRGHVEQLTREEAYEYEDEVESEPETEVDESQSEVVDEDEEITEEVEEPAEEEEPTILSYDEITSIALSEQEGNITELNLIDEDEFYFQLIIEDDEMVYEMVIDAYEGTVISLQSEAKTPDTVVSEEEAVEIVLSEIEGDVTYVELREIEGSLYYFMTVVMNEEEQAIAQVNAFSGEIHSVAWEEREEENDSEENEEEEE
ncbi:PepSY domain-containing protein [Alkalibacillus haloalkaliphilus]|uniref:PepSY domain-containing protein n=1 Tax=Alkalibacillus haloalkaliphilus TaxID=94136 RepID=UPI0029366786|nr:PepSY domain-containing protein [Alkalibacillus haloalkaliphilus]MDV2582332.1 PepSY domain-containing protein [Alkalibacillus haloalkaliphilus]